MNLLQRKRMVRYLKWKKIFTSIVFTILIFFSITKPVQASLFSNDDDTEIKETIEKDDGGLFEKIIAKMIRWNCRNSI